MTTTTMDRRPTEWVAQTDNCDYDLLPPHRPVRHARWCLARHPCGYTCTRAAGHTGRHAAGDGTRIQAVWEPEKIRTMTVSLDTMVLATEGENP